MKLSNRMKRLLRAAFARGLITAHEINFNSMNVGEGHTHRIQQQREMLRDARTGVIRHRHPKYREVR